MIDAEIDSRQLKIFSVTARHQSFTTAAKELGLTQSAVSHALKNLEENLGCQLLTRGRRSIHLTSNGERALPITLDILTKMSQIRHEVRNEAAWTISNLRLGATPTICQHLLPPVFREFKECFPDSDISIRPGETLTIVDELKRNEVDAVIGIKPFDMTGLEFRPLFEDEMHLIVSPLHRWAKLESIPVRDAGDENFILYSKGSYTGQLITSYFATHGVPLSSTIELGNFEAIREMIKVGIGISITSSWDARSDLESGAIKMIELEGGGISRTWGMILRKDHHAGLVEETLYGLCQMAADNLLLTHKVG